jgi:prevent-host-death family protein
MRWAWSTRRILVAPDAADATALAQVAGKRYLQRVHLEVPMRAVFTDDVKPVTDLKVQASSMVDQVVRTGRPMLITRRGRGVAVLVDVEQFERMQEALAFGQAVDEGAAQAERGEFATDAEVEAVLGRRAK